MDINNKVAIITGGASGLGEATVRHFHGLGARIAIFDLNDARGKAIAAEFDNDVIYLNVNVTDPESVKAAVAATMDAFKAIHICCNYAGIAHPLKTIGRDGPGDLDRFINVINVNLVGTFNVCRLVAFEMAKNEVVNEDGGRGVIINTSSIAAYEGQIGQAAYSASKGGIIGMTLPMARDLARNGIRVNALAPGIIHTPLFDALPETLYDSLVSSTLFPQRLGKPEEIAHLAQFIVENDYTNGECIRMDSGIRMQPK